MTHKATNMRDEIAAAAGSIEFYEGVTKSWRIPDLLVGFVKVNVEITPDWDVPYFLEKPWKWAEELRYWVACGKPLGPGDPGFMRFAEKVLG